jgi:hypothetical protein
MNLEPAQSPTWVNTVKGDPQAPPSSDAGQRADTRHGVESSLSAPESQHKPRLQPARAETPIRIPLLSVAYTGMYRNHTSKGPRCRRFRLR